MGHYDDYYEEEAERHRKELKQQQDNCQHDFAPISCDEQGRTTKAQCTKCHKIILFG